MIFDCRIARVVTALLLWISAAAEGQSYMEAGVALVGQASADYRGSKHYQPYALPLPYFIYQGPVLKADKDGIRGDFWANHRFEFNVSVAGSLNGRSDNNELRQGMPELDSAFEFGPSFNINISGSGFNDGWVARFPLRGVFTIGGGGVDYIGILFNPRLTWRLPNAFWGWRTSYNMGVLFADRTYHSYYYDVAPEFTMQGRPYYRASSGYSGAFTQLSFYRRIDQWRIGAAFRYDNLQGVSFDESPLVETPHYGSVSFGVIRTLWMN